MRRFPSLLRFFRHQALYLSVAAVVAALFWALGQQINPATIVIYSLCFGNLLTPPMERLRCKLSRRTVLYRGMVSLGALLALAPLVYLITSALVWRFAPPSHQTLTLYIATGWKFPFLIILVFGASLGAYNEAKNRLEQRNVELQRSVEQSAAQLELQEQEMERAREIQESLLPKDIPQVPGFEISSAWRPAREVGGDYFDVLKLGEARLGICIADVVGKGVSAALLMANVQATVRAFARDAASPAALCARVNSVLCGNIGAEKFVTFFYAILDAGRSTFQYCNAGHPAPILASPDSIRQLSADDAVLGVFPEWEYRETLVTLTPGDRLLLFTDGISEAVGVDGTEFGESHLAAIAQDAWPSTSTELNRRVFAQASDFCQGRFQDDATLLVITVS